MPRAGCDKGVFGSESDLLPTDAGVKGSEAKAKVRAQALLRYGIGVGSHDELTFDVASSSIVI